jgi:outer membrane protein OmpA-like peptidoglycan-associated protein/Tol biopolymer transport system component
MKSYHSLIFLAFSFLISACATAQSGLSTTNKKAIQLFNEGRLQFEYKKNAEAYELLKKATEQDDLFYEAHMLLADVCNDLDKKDEAIAEYKRAVSIQPERFAPAYYNLAGVEMDKDLYADAIIHLNKFLSFRTLSPEMRKKGERRFASAQFAENATKNPVPFIPINLGDKINSIHNDYHPSLTVDENILIYTRMRPADENTDNGGSQVEEDFYLSTRVDGSWKQSIPLGSPINTHGNEGAHSISPDGRFFYFTGCERPEGYGSCDLYVSERNGDSWSKPKNLGEPMNSGAWDAQPTISPDGKTLVFTSRRSGGLGMADLWTSTRRDNGTWTMPVNLGDSINTDLDEFGPFLHPDGKTLFFSSAGHPGMGGKDIFYSKKNANGTWGKPVNIGYPINSKGDEIQMIVSADGKKGYFSSDREGGVGQRDIYTFDLYELARPQAVTFIRGTVRDAKTLKGLKATIEVIDLANGELRASTISDASYGEFLVSLPSGSSYAINVDSKGYMFYSGNYTLGEQLTAKDEYKVDILLSPVLAGAKVVLNNIFFESGKAELKPESKVELNKLVQFLTNNPGVRIEIGGHTDAIGNDASNQALSEQRAKSVTTYLIANKVDAARLESKGYGKSKPLATNETETGRAINRRTEFSIISVQ